MCWPPLLIELNLTPSILLLSEQHSPSCHSLVPCLSLMENEARGAETWAVTAVPWHVEPVGSIGGACSNEGAD